MTSCTTAYLTELLSLTYEITYIYKLSLKTENNDEFRRINHLLSCISFPALNTCWRTRNCYLWKQRWIQTRHTCLGKTIAQHGTCNGRPGFDSRLIGRGELRYGTVSFPFLVWQALKSSVIISVLRNVNEKLFSLILLPPFMTLKNITKPVRYFSIYQH